MFFAKNLHSFNNTVLTAGFLYHHIKGMRLTPIFDLDGVLLCAAHRMQFLPCGALDLDHYSANSTPDKIAQDRTLPLTKLINKLNQSNHIYHVATARILCPANFALLQKHGINPRLALHRESETNDGPDHEMKAALLDASFGPYLRHKMILIDDNRKNCQAAQALGFLAVHIQP